MHGARLPFVVCAFRPVDRAAAVFEPLRAFRRPSGLGDPGTPAARNVEYWAGAPEPWRNRTADAAITDAGIIREEEQFKAAAEQEDAGLSPEERGRNLHRRGIRVDYLLALTYALNLWGWTTKEVPTH